MSTTPTALTDPAALPDWRASLPEDMRDNAVLKDVKDVPSLAKRLVDAQSFIGSAIKMPKADAAQEELDKFYTRLGRPETPDKYDLKRPEMPEGVGYDEELETHFRTMAHKAGLNNRQVQGLLDSYNAIQLQRITAADAQMKQSTEETTKALQQEWGAGFEKNLNLAMNAVQTFGGEELKKELDATGLGNHPLLIRAFAKIGEKFSEEMLVLGDQPIADSSSIATIKAKREAVMKSPAFMSRIDNQEHREAIAENERLTKQLMDAGA